MRTLRPRDLTRVPVPRTPEPLLQQEGVSAAIEHAGGDPAHALRLISEQLGIISCEPGFRGCPFINAAAEYPDPTSAVRVAVDAHRAWCRSTFEDLVRPLDLADPAGAAADLMLLRDGAMVAGYLDDAEALAESFLRSGLAVIGARPA